MFDQWVILLAMVACAALVWACWYGVTWYVAHRDVERAAVIERYKTSPELFEAQTMDPVPDGSPEARMRSANAVGIGYAAPAFDPAPGYFWKKDAASSKWRLYRTPVGS